ncbi:MAG: hypothetical protein ABIS86_22450 [Streptosporangiaceae bacterium]
MSVSRCSLCHGHGQRRGALGFFTCPRCQGSTVEKVDVELSARS